MYNSTAVHLFMLAALERETLIMSLYQKGNYAGFAPNLFTLIRFSFFFCNCLSFCFKDSTRSCCAQRSLWPFIHSKRLLVIYCMSDPLEMLYWYRNCNYASSFLCLFFLLFYYSITTGWWSDGASLSHILMATRAGIMHFIHTFFPKKCEF